MQALDQVLSRTLAPSATAVAERCYASAFRALAEEDFESARRLFALLTLLEPRAERSWVGLAVAHERDRRFPAAAALYAIGERLLPGGSAWLCLGRGRSLRALGRTRDAEAAFDAAEAATSDPRILKAIEEER
jgi:hypothetical protein